MIYIIVVVNILLASFAQIILKKGASVNHESFWGDYVNPHVISGYFILGVTLLINIFAMSQGVKLKELSIMETMSYIFIPILSSRLLRENITNKQKMSILVIVAGIIIFFI